MRQPAPLGILMLDTRFPRIPGDIGNPNTWPFDILTEIVPAAVPQRVVRENAEGLLPAFVAAGEALVALGAVGITTSCGFLSLFQKELSEALPVPVATSSLMQVGLVNQLLPPGRRAGVLTIADTLSPLHLSLAGAPEDTPVASTEGGTTFTQAILSDQAAFDIDAARADNVAAAQSLVRDFPEVGAIVLECTNMGPYAADIAAATGRPVYSIVTFIQWFHNSLQPPRWDQGG